MDDVTIFVLLVLGALVMIGAASWIKSDSWDDSGYNPPPGGWSGHGG